MKIYGKNTVKEYLETNENISKAYFLKDFNDQFILSALEKRNINTIFLSKYEIDRLVKGNHQGVILEIPDYQYAQLEEIIKPDGLIVILDHLEDPHNLGAIIRTCEAAGVDGIIIPKDRGVMINSTVAKVSVGTINNVKIVAVANINNTIKKLKDKGYWLIGTAMEGTDYREIDYTGSIALVIGNEGKGISALVKDNCDFIATIPQKGKVNSLNASVATGIILFNALSKR